MADFGVFERRQIHIETMIKENKQSFKSKHHNLKHVFRSDMLKVNKDGIKYEKDFNQSNGKQILAVSKYTKLSNLEKSVNEGTFYFGSPYDWLDPFELLFYQPKMNIRNEGAITIHACCFTCNDIENEEGFWQIWSIDEKEPIVRVTYNVDKLLASLNKRAENIYTFYLAGMVYQTRDNILKYHREPQNYYYEETDDYLNKLCLKRNSYKYENELRLFVKKTAYDDQNDNDNKTLVKIDYNDGIITEITLPPATPYGNTHLDNDTIKNYQENQKHINYLTIHRLQSLVDKRKLVCEINQSALYCTNVNSNTYKI